MCRLAAFPPGFQPGDAYDIMEDQCGGNKDGVGTGYIDLDNNSAFVRTRFPGSLQDAMKKKVPLFDHMPSKSWTLAHVRAATHGGNEVKNTHPFIKNDWMMVHNGVFHPSDAIRYALGDMVKWEGETDSETALYLFERDKPAIFSKAVTTGGVFMGLHRKNFITVVKTSGDLELREDEQFGLFLASDIKGDYEAKDVGNGIITISQGGKVVKEGTTAEIKKKVNYSSTSYYNSNSGESYESWRNRHLPFSQGQGSTATSGQGNGASGQTVTLCGAKQRKVISGLSLWHLDPDAKLEDVLSGR